MVVTADVRRLDRIVGNILDNARQHAPGAPVEVEVGRTMQTEPPMAVVRVADRGPGVAPARSPTCSIGSTRPTPRGQRQLRPGSRDRRRARRTLGGRLIAENRARAVLLVALLRP
jgi:hypothetical protein